jgi:hypothetical protein
MNRLGDTKMPPFAQLSYAWEGGGKTFYAVRAVLECGGVVIDTEGKWGVTGVPWADLDAVEGAASRLSNEELAGLLCGHAVFIPPNRYAVAIRIAEVLASANAAGQRITPLIVMDGFTSFQEKAQATIGEQRAGQHTGQGTMDPRALDQRGWQYLLADQLRLISLLSPASTGAFLYATAGMKEMENPAPEAPGTPPQAPFILRPDLAGAFGNKVGKYFDLVTPMFHQEVAKGKLLRRMYLRPVGRFTTRDSWEHKGWCPDYIDEPDLLDTLTRLEEAQVWAN